MFVAAAVAVPVVTNMETKTGNMNGKYAVTSRGDVNTNWNSDYASKGYEYFDVWAPEIATHYGEVFWTDQGSTPLPDHIVKRFDGKVIAIQGYEQDQVMVDPVGKPGVNPERDVSVPINWAYNHHYCAWMAGKHSERKEIPVPGDVYGSGAHGMKTMIASVDKKDFSETGPRLWADVAQTSWFISEGNGGESRKSFHGYPQGYAQLVESPTSWHITPMQIDTRNREHGVGPESVRNCTDMNKCAGYEPRQARYGRGWGGVSGRPKEVDGYSGILECPCNSRYGGDPQFYPDAKTKVLQRSFAAIPGGECERSFQHAQECFDAVAALGFNASKVTNDTAKHQDLPHGCLFVEGNDGSAEALYNEAGSGKCAASSLVKAQSTSARNKVTFGLSLDAKTKVATITIKGPSTGYIAVGLDAQAMADQPYTIIVNSTGALEHKLGTCGTEADHCAGTLLATSVKVISNTVEDGVRSVVLTRAFDGASKNHYTFDPAKVATLQYISAAGPTQTFGYHGFDGKDALTMSFSGVSPVCICDLGENGDLCWNTKVAPGTWGRPNDTSTHCAHFQKNCVARQPDLGKAGTPESGDLLYQHNPTCNSGQYSGGLSCCKHKRIMLDEDQEVPKDLLRYHMKFRFWFQEYVPAVRGKTNASHIDLPRIYWQTEGHAGEYDIPPAFWVEGKDPKIVGYPEVGPYPELTPGTACTGDCPHGDSCECIHTITFNNTVSNMRLIYAGGHCHAPSCIGIWLYRNDPGHEMELLCHQAPIYGNGTGVNSIAGMYDEAGYLALPPCLWGDEPGLHPSVLLPPNTPLVSIKKNYNTHKGHFGEMASWQMRGINF
jgi:hypothetical protein